MALQGSLQDFGIAEILQLIGSQQKTGILYVESNEGAEVQIYFSSGRIIRCEAAGKDKRDPVGTRLLAAELISKEQLNDATKLQKQTLKRVGDILVDQGAVTNEALLEFVDLVAKEQIFQLFEWKAGKYRFESRPPNFARPLGSPISSETVLMEGFRMLDEWPLIRAKINNYNVVYRTLRTLEDSETDADALERILDDAFSEFVDVPVSQAAPKKKGQTGEARNLERPARRVLSLVDGKRDVHRLVDLSRLGEFETCKALLTLLNEGYIAPVKVKKALEAPGLRRKIDWSGLFGKLFINGAVLAALVAAVLFMPRSRVELQQNAAQVSREAVGRLRTNRLAPIGTALEIFRVEHGSYPETLETLVKEGLLAEGALKLPGGAPHYLAIGVDYDLR